VSFHGPCPTYCATLSANTRPTGHYRFSRLAEADLEAIFAFGAHNFGLDQARRYHEGLEHTLSLLADYPNLGRPDDSLPGAPSRFGYVSHIVFYDIIPSGILVLRILYARSEIPTNF
jgi:toxin ParE1/3/4